MDSLDLTKHYTVVGLGSTGRSVVRFLRARGAVLNAVDASDWEGRSAALDDEFPGLNFDLGEPDVACLDSTDVLVVSPGVPRESMLVREARSRGLEIIGDIEIFARVANAPVVAVTGTNGKSTVVSMLDACGAASELRVATGGNLGTPALDLLAQDVELYVLELSSYQLETTHSLAPMAAALLNVTPDHLDRYPGGFDDYLAAKHRVFRGATHCVVEAGNPLVRPVLPDATQHWVTVNTTVVGEGGVKLVAHEGATWIAFGDEPVVDIESIAAPGEHNLTNACFVVALAHLAKLPHAAISAGLSAFAGLPHRTEPVREVDGVRFINDSKGTNVGATCVALESTVGPTVLIAGGVGKAQDFSPLAGALAAHGRALVVFGRDAQSIAGAVEDTVPVHHASTLDDAVRAAHQIAKSGDAVLFSPACSSFDMFRNFEERGNAFRQSVEALAS
ncbi:MAG: UDP-N-acetylmuramoyl-L-alanine--D-glutamate ligase [Pseudomonadota bacterium]